MNVSLKAMNDPDCQAIALAMCGVSKVSLEVLDLWIGMIAYHHFATHEEAIELEQQKKGYNGRFGCSAKVYNEGVKVLTKIGLIEGKATKMRVLPAAEFLEKAAKKYEAKQMGLGLAA